MQPRPEPNGESSTVEVTVFRGGVEVARELYDTPEEAALGVERWNESPGMTFQVDDLAVHHGPSDIRDPSPDEGWAFDADAEERPSGA